MYATQNATARLQKAQPMHTAGGGDAKFQTANDNKNLAATIRTTKNKKSNRK